MEIFVTWHRGPEGRAVVVYYWALDMGPPAPSDCIRAFWF